MEHNGTKRNNLERFGTVWNTQRGEQMQNATQELEQVEKVTPSAIYQNNIYALVDDIKQDKQFNGLTDEELKNNKAFFPRLVDYIYNNYIGDLLGNKHGKQVLYTDIQSLDNLFSIYIDLVYKYKWNNRPLLIEFSLFTGINRDTFYNWVNGNTTNTDGQTGSKYLTRERSDMVRKWIGVCERALLDGTDTIKDLFILKCKHGYKESEREIVVNINKPLLSADELPKLTDIKSNN